MRNEHLNSLSKNSPVYELEQILIAGDYYLRGNSWNSNGSQKNALRDFTSAIEIYDGNWFFYQNRGFTFYITNKYEEAIEDYTKAIEIDANNEASYFQRATVYHETGNKKQALEDAKVAYKLNPIHPSIETLLKEIQK
jgi:tetratricopeptide (TPR) repeat protein